MSYRIYPITASEPAMQGYRVWINGEEAPLHAARVSAVPFNRRWPGHQRQIEQTELAPFLSLATDQPLHFEILLAEPSACVRIRPRSLGITPTVTEDGRISFTLEKPAYFTVEPYGRRTPLHVFADPMPHYEIDRSDPNLLYFGAGEHDAGLIELQSNQTLFLDEGAVVYASIIATHADNIRILGRGILDNSKNKEEILYEASVDNNREGIPNANRRHAVQLEYCRNIEIDGITLRDSLVFTIRPLGCESLHIQNVKIIGNWRYNSDGIDMHNCLDVHIADCFIRTYDDCICIKGFARDYSQEQDTDEEVTRQPLPYDTFERVLIERCVVWNDWNNALEIGAETGAREMRDITFRDCDLIHLAGVALDCFNVDHADVHEVLFENIRIEMDEPIPKPAVQKRDDECYVNTDPDYTPLTVCVRVAYHHEYSISKTRRGKNRNMRFHNIRVYGTKPIKMRFAGYDEAHKTENITIEGLYQNDQPVLSLSDEGWDLREFTENIRLLGAGEKKA